MLGYKLSVHVFGDLLACRRRHSVVARVPAL